MLNKNNNNGWANLLKNEKQKIYFKKIINFLKIAYKNEIIYPKQNEIFKALQLTPQKNCKVVILGQDPYHGPNQAHGLAFSVLTKNLPPSLQNILKEVFTTTNCRKRDGNLTGWAKQGVLLLNSILTVKKASPQSHKNIGWQTFTDEVILKLNYNKNPIVFLLWGNFAKLKIPLIKNPAHLILTAPHPSPLSAHRGFFGCNHFKLANKFLISTNQTPINWQV